MVIWWYRINGIFSIFIYYNLLLNKNRRLDLYSGFFERFPPNKIDRNDALKVDKFVIKFNALMRAFNVQTVALFLWNYDQFVCFHIISISIFKYQLLIKQFSQSSFRDLFVNYSTKADIVWTDSCVLFQIKKKKKTSSEWILNA